MEQQTETKQARKTVVLSIVAMLIVAVGIALIIIFADKIKDARVAQPEGEYQAVFLSNNQVYFGRLDIQRRWSVLTDIYYLQTNENEALQPAGSEDEPAVQQPRVELVKLGSELHGPEDAMYIAPDKILFWENLGSDSRVLQSIRQYQNQ